MEALARPRDVVVTDGIPLPDVRRSARLRARGLCESHSPEAAGDRPIHPNEETVGGSEWNLGTRSRLHARKFAKAARSIRMSSPSPLSRSWPGRHRRTIETLRNFRAHVFHAGAARAREHGTAALSGRTDNTSPVLTLITQFGGGKTHTLTTLYHLARNGDAVADHNGVADLVRDAGVRAVPKAKVAVFVGNAWDPQSGRETPWVDIAHQLAGDTGVEALGAAAKTTPPGTDAIARVFQAAGAPVPYSSMRS